MCYFKSWYYDEGGYIIQCEDCKHFQVSFGTSMLTLDERQYQTFTRMVCLKKEEHAAMQNTDCKCIILPTPSSSVHTILSEKELMHLYEMVQAADIEIKTDHMISLFGAEN